ncbi:hypothetical protein HanPSC8_Chr04g0137071 [Helianthus annuus]|nr:hypothetical protein HanPSC8_Chr04g0137071 [Helianthus annuus]
MGHVESDIPKNLKSFLHLTSLHAHPLTKVPQTLNFLIQVAAHFHHHRRPSLIIVGGGGHLLSYSGVVHHIPASLGQNYLTLVSTAPTIVIVHTTSSAAGRQGQDF